MSRARTYCWTLGADQLTKEELKEKLEKTNPRYYVFGLETAPTTGWLHYQGCVQYNNARRFESLKKQIHNTIHISEKYHQATEVQAAAYCKKDGDFVEWGSLAAVKRGRESSDDSKDEMLEDIEILDKIDFMKKWWIKYMRVRFVVDELYKKKEAAAKAWQDEPREVWVAWGPSGCGKTTLFDHLNLGPCVDVPPGSTWFDQAACAENVRFDEFAGGWPIHELLYLTDNTNKIVRCRYGDKPWKPHRILITSTKHPRDWYEWNGRYDEFKRRVTHFIVMNADHTYEENKELL